VVVGRLTFQEDGDVIDCARMGVGGKAIPPNVDKVMRLSRLSCDVTTLIAPDVHVWVHSNLHGRVVGCASHSVYPTEGLRAELLRLLQAPGVPNVP
jgi:hypothetical protein